MDILGRRELDIFSETILRYFPDFFTIKLTRLILFSHHLDLLMFGDFLLSEKYSGTNNYLNDERR